MVSTRGVKYKFTDGERVLCYEPDPTKAKVLYDSKVLEVIVGKDERGRKNVEYLIHFQGWNSSWDRCVSEDFVLKDTEENRKLQKDLADKAQLQLGAYLYRRERKKRSRNLSQKINESWESGTNSCSSKKSQEEDENEEQEEDLVTTSDDDNVSSMDTDDSLDERIPVDISNYMKILLEKDYDLIHNNNKIVSLPASPNVLEILEGYVRHFSMSQLRTNEETGRRRRSRSQFREEGRDTDPVKDFENMLARLNLCKEVVDGLRVYFDFTLGQLLLYDAERPQYEEMQIGLKEYVKKEPSVEIKMECESLSEDDTSQNVSQSSADVIAEVKIEPEHLETERKRSLRSHREPVATNEPSCSISQPPITSVVPVVPAPVHVHVPLPVPVPVPVHAPAPNNGISKLTIRNLGTLGHLSAAALTNNHCSTMSTSSTSSYYSPLVGKIPTSPGCSAINVKVAKLIDHTNTWKMVPQWYMDERPHNPAAIYGAVHLARLFVKLPNLLYIANQPEKENQPRLLPERKMKALIFHLQSFLTYLETKSEWFDEKHYIDNAFKKAEPTV